MNAVRIVVVDDHALFRAGLIGLLKDIPEFKVVGEAADGQEALEVIHQTQPEVVLMDINMPVMNGVEAVEALHNVEKCRILMLTISRQEKDLFGAISAGADGYILKNAEPEELKKAILDVAAGSAVLSPEVTHSVLKVVASYASPGSEKGVSRREVEVLDCLGKGMTTLQIAEHLFVSENTVKTHIRHILDKLGASNRAEAVGKATRLGLIRP